MVRISVILVCFGLLACIQSIAQTAPSTFEFVENKGQWHNSVQFRGQLSSGEFYLQKNGFTISLHHPDDLSVFLGGHSHDKKSDKKNRKIDYSRDLSGKINNKTLGGGRRSSIVRSHAYSVEFVGGNANPQIISEKPLQTYNNYFLGNDPSKWVSEAKIYQSVLYRNVYPNIDVRYYSEDGKLKFDFIIHPGGDPSRISMKYNGADKLSIRNNELVIKTSVGDVRELYPYTYQPDNTKGRKKVECKYVLTGNNTVKFEVGEYSRSAPLIIDPPSLIFVSFTGSPANQYGFTATPGPDGSLFSGGIVFEPGFPTTPGAFQTDFQGGARGNNTQGTDIGIMKFSPNGSQRVYATYIGGTLNEYPHSLYSDGVGNLVVMGRSYSTDYPGIKVGPTGGGDIVVTKLNAGGTALIGSLIIGGSAMDGVNIEDVQSTHDYKQLSLLRNYGDDSRSEVIIGPDASVYVAAQTHSADFPVTAGAFQASKSGRQDGVVMRINPNCTGLVWASFLGGTGDDGAFVLDLNPANGDIYVGGGTSSADESMPGFTAGPMGGAYAGGDADGFVSIISPNGATIRKTVYLGRGNADIIYGLKFDRRGFPYIMGVSRGGQWPVQAAAFSQAGSSQFVAKLTPDLSAFEYSTVFGSGSARPNMSPVAFLVDRCENVYISGWGGWISASEANDPFDQAGVAGMTTTPDAVKRNTDNQDFYLIVIQKNAATQLYGSFFGQDRGATGEHVDGGTSRFDAQGVIYQAICANCGGGAQFPTTPGVIGPVNGSPSSCNLAAVKMAFNFAGVGSGPRPVFNGVRDSLGCAPFTVLLQDTVGNAVSYEWDFGDGTDTVTLAPVREVLHTFQNVGTYRIRLIAIDSNTCNERDTAYTTVVVGDNEAFLRYDYEKLDPCEQLNYRFYNNSSTSAGPSEFRDSSFIWNFGDGTDPVYTDGGDVDHAFLSPGTYMVTITLNDPLYCNAPQTDTLQVFVNAIVDARILTPASGCAPYEAQFTNMSLAGRTFIWNFGDGSPISNDVNPVHLYQNPGNYTVTLRAIDSGTCNIVDDTSVVITVAARPAAEFSHTPVVPVQNTPTIFTNLSTGGVRYKWLFGDGDSVIKNTRDTVLHQYNATGTYNACLITYNEFDCTDTVCHEVAADVLPLFDVPNAFTPGKFGRNSTIRVEGFGIARMTWTIYNRWGQVVFQTNDRKFGWDGTSKGVPQPMDVYQYTLDIQFVDGSTRRRTGDITLIR